MKKKTIIIMLVALIIISLYFIINFSVYFAKQKQNQNRILYCSLYNTNNCYTSAFELLLPKILINEVSIDGIEHELIKLEYTSRIDSAYALWLSDVLIGYGVYFDVNYEEAYSIVFNKYSYAYDCGVPTFTPRVPFCKFASECLATDTFLISDQVSSKKIHSLSQKIKELNLENKKIFIKMDIAEADIIGITELLKNYENITGFSLALHIRTPKDIIDRLPLLDEINKKFVLVARSSLYSNLNMLAFVPHTKYYKGMLNDQILYLSYINKNIIDSYHISWQQNTDKYYKKKSVLKLLMTNEIPYSDISYVVTLTEKIKSFFKNNER